MHILLIPSWYTTADNPISGVFFREQALALKETGHRVGVLVAPAFRYLRELRKIRSASELSVSMSVEDDCGLATYRTRQWAWFSRLFPAGNRWLMVRVGLQAFERYLLEQGRPDVIHAHSILYGGYLAVQIRRSWHAPVVVTEHSSAFLRGLIRPHQNRIVKYTLEHADRVLAVSEALASSVREYCPDYPVDVLGNMVDTVFFVPASDKPASSDFVFAAVALLSPKKGLDVSLRAFALAFRDKPVQLHIGGEGGERQFLERLSHELGIDSQVKFLGQLSREEVRSLLQQSHALVSSSPVETFGVTLIEAMACGKPVITARSGGPESFVQDHNGLQVTPGDPSSLATAMQKMVQEYARYDPDLIRADCVSRFSEQVIVRRLDRIYRGLVASR